MAYTPVNLSIYTAALAGAAAGLGASSRVPSAQISTDPNDISIADIAESFAESYDTQWGIKVGVSANALQVAGSQLISEAFWEGRGYFTSVAALLPSTYTTFCNALIAVVQAGVAAAAAQGVTPSAGALRVAATTVNAAAVTVDTGYKPATGLASAMLMHGTLFDLANNVMTGADLDVDVRNAIGTLQIAGQQFATDGIGDAALSTAAVVAAVSGAGTLEFTFTPPAAYVGTIKWLFLSYSLVEVA